jgi:putative flavoprotein involved in K+ transport
MTLVGTTTAFTSNSNGDGVLTFAPDIAANIAKGDADYLAVLDEADAYIARTGMDLPPEPAARVILPDPACVTDPIRALNLKEAGITTIIWATGFALDYSWLKFDVLGADGKPKHSRGISEVPGLYFVGLPWLSRRGSSFIWGVWHDARFIADQIGIQRSYEGYQPPATVQAKEA